MQHRPLSEGLDTRTGLRIEVPSLCAGCLSSISVAFDVPCMDSGGYGGSMCLFCVSLENMKGPVFTSLQGQGTVLDSYISKGFIRSLSKLTCLEMNEMKLQRGV